jgi:hypothetical protein
VASRVHSHVAKCVEARFGALAVLKAFRLVLVLPMLVSQPASVSSCRVFLWVLARQVPSAKAQTASHPKLRLKFVELLYFCRFCMSKIITLHIF